MFSVLKIRNLISLCVIIIINLIFVFKYSAEYFDSPGLISAIYFLSVYTLLKITNKPFGQKVAKFIKDKYWTISGIIILIAVLFIYLVPRIGTVGRITAIEEWLGLLFNGIYPYSSYITPSAFPAFYILVLPFYLIGQLGFLEVIGLVIMLFVIKAYAVNDKNLLVTLLLLFTSPIIFHDFVVRSELTFNISLFVLLATLLRKIEHSENTKIAIFGILFGLTLSTRSVMIVPLMTFMLFYFRNDIKKLFLFGMIIALVFVLQLLPLIIWDSNLFWEFGPFAIQSHLADLPTWFIVFCILISIYIGWSVQNIREVFLAAGLILFSMIVVSYLSKIFEYGFQLAFFGDNYIDPAYLAFVFPFLLFAIEDYEIIKPLGRRL